MSLDSRLWQLFVSVLELDPATPSASVRLRDTPNWDSLGHMGLVAAIENEFDVLLTADQVIAMDDFGAALALIRASVPQV